MKRGKIRKNCRLSEKSFLLFIQQLRGITYTTLKFMRSTCGKSRRTVIRDGRGRGKGGLGV